MSEPEQPQLPLDDPEFERWEAGARAQRRRLDAPLERLKARLAERAAATEEPEGQDLDEDLVLVVDEGELPPEAVEDLHGRQAQQEAADLDLDEGGRPYPF
jgi:hypothetical protein